MKAIDFLEWLKYCSFMSNTTHLANKKSRRWKPKLCSALRFFHHHPSFQKKYCFRFLLVYRSLLVSSYRYCWQADASPNQTYWQEKYCWKKNCGKNIVDKNSVVKNIVETKYVDKNSVVKILLSQNCWQKYCWQTDTSPNYIDILAATRLPQESIRLGNITTSVKTGIAQTIVKNTLSYAIWMSGRKIGKHHHFCKTGIAKLPRQLSKTHPRKSPLLKRRWLLNCPRQLSKILYDLNEWQEVTQLGV